MNEGAVGEQCIFQWRYSRWVEATEVVPADLHQNPVWVLESWHVGRGWRGGSGLLERIRIPVCILFLFGSLWISTPPSERDGGLSSSLFQTYCRKCGGLIMGREEKGGDGFVAHTMLIFCLTFVVLPSDQHHLPSKTLTCFHIPYSKHLPIANLWCCCLPNGQGTSQKASNGRRSSSCKIREKQKVLSEKAVRFPTHWPSISYLNWYSVPQASLASHPQETRTRVRWCQKGEHGLPSGLFSSHRSFHAEPCHRLNRMACTIHGIPPTRTL